MHKAMSELVNYLNDPTIVANFQKVFGIEAGFKSEQKTTRKRNVSISKSKINGLNSDDTHNLADNYRIHNQFWFYLFHLGAAMGNELFYSLFFPFWVIRICT